MNQIKPYSLWIGHTGDGRAFTKALDQGIRTVVQLAISEPPIELPRDFVYFRFPLLDGTGNDPCLLNLAISTVASLVEQAMPTLVCCGAGMSRSPAIVAATISRIEHINLNASLRRITEHHAADVSPGLWKDVCGSEAGHVVGH